MEPQEILIKKKLDTKVLDGLEVEKHYNVISKDGIGDFLLLAKTEYGYHFEDEWGGITYEYPWEDYTHIYLPLTVTQEMVEKEANKHGAKNVMGYYCFTQAIKWLLSLTKDKE